MKYCALIILLCLLSACSSPSKLLCNSWKIDEVDFLDSLNTFTPAQKEMLTKALKTNLDFTFYADSSYQVRSGKDVYNYKWWMDGNKKQFYTRTNEGKITQARILELKKGYLKFESAGEDLQWFRFTCSPLTKTK